MFRLLSAALFGAAVLGDETKPDEGVTAVLPMRGELVTCSGWKLNKLLEPKSFIEQDCDIEPRRKRDEPPNRKAGPCDMFPELHIRFENLRIPEIFFGRKGERSETEDKVNLEEMTREEIRTLLVSRGFTQKDIPAEELRARDRKRRVDERAATDEEVARRKREREKRGDPPLSRQKRGQKPNIRPVVDGKPMKGKKPRVKPGSDKMRGKKPNVKPVRDGKPAKRKERRSVEDVRKEKEAYRRKQEMTEKNRERKKQTPPKLPKTDAEIYEELKEKIRDEARADRSLTLKELKKRLEEEVDKAGLDKTEL